MVELAYDAVPIPRIAADPSPEWGDDRPEPVPHWERVKSRPRAICPTRKDRASTHHERVGQEIRVVLVDDHLSFRQPLAFMLMREADITIIGQAGTVADARPLLPQADIALVDLDLPDGEGVELIHDLRAINPQAIALLLTASASNVAMARAVEAGAAGVLHKTRSVSEITEAIRRVHAGEPLLSVRETIEMLRFVGQHRERNRAAQVAISQLTQREKEVLAALGHGLHDREIAERLHIQTETVRTHMVNLLRKIDVDSRLQALVFAVKYGLVDLQNGNDDGS
jgi:DNA-binding NarL/FixJ family response regulator